MATHRDFGSLARRLDAMKAEVRNGVKAKRDRVFVAGAIAVGNLTPVDTLEARTSWVPGSGGTAPAAGATGPRLPSMSAAENLAAGKFDESAGASFTEERARKFAAASQQVDGRLTLTNTADHIQKLDDGGSPQLPTGGFVAIGGIAMDREAREGRILP